MATLNVDVSISPTRLLWDNAPLDLMKFILDIDRVVAEADFTEGLIIALCKSLFSEYEWNDKALLLKRLEDLANDVGE